MNQLVFIENNQTVTDSLLVAEVFGKEHRRVMQDIRSLECSEEFKRHNFVQIEYTDSRNRSYPKYIITQDGFSFLVMGYTGKEAARFKEMYIAEFNRMKEQLSKPNSTKLLLQTALEHEEKIESIKADVSYLKENMRIDGVQEFQIRQGANSKVVKVLGGKDAPAYEILSGKTFSRFWRDFKIHFTVPRYGELPKVKFDEAMDFIDEWQPDTTTRLEIKAVNEQQVFKADHPVLERVK